MTTFGWYLLTSIFLIIRVCMLLGSLPELPVRERFEAPLPEGEVPDADDEVNLDPIALRSTYTQKAVQEISST